MRDRTRQTRSPVFAGFRVFCLTTVCGACLSFNVIARSRQSIEPQRRWVATEISRWLARPALHLEEILGPALRLEAMPYSQIETVMKRKLAEKDVAAEQAAACHLVLAKTAYWRAAAEFRRTHDRSAFQGVAETVWAEMLAAFPSALNLSADNPVRVIAVREARSLLAGALFGKRLTPEFKKRIVAEFIDPISKQPDGPASWPVAQKARVFRNLGIADRLEFRLPNPLPEDDTWTLQKLAREALAVDPKAALPVADALEKQTAESHTPKSVSLIVEIWRRTGRIEKARAYLEHCRDKFPWCLPIYYSFLGKLPNPPSPESRVQLLLQCLDWFDAEQRKPPEKRRKTPVSRTAVYDRIEALLFAGGYWKETLEVIERGEKNHVRSYETDRDRYIRALCLDHLSRTREALRYYKKVEPSLHGPMREKARARIQTLEKNIASEKSGAGKRKEGQP